MTAKPNYKTAEWGYLYCLSNETQPALVKIGMTTDTPQQRAKQLSAHSGVATPFRVEFAKWVHRPYRLEQELHCLLQAKGIRVHHRREHFRMTPYEALQYFYWIEGEWSPAPSPYLTRPPPSSLPTYGRPPQRTSGTVRLSPPLPRILQTTLGEYSPLESQEIQEPGAAPIRPVQTIPQGHVSTCGVLLLLAGLCLIFYLILTV
jgi:hypothetical protein